MLMGMTDVEVDDDWSPLDDLVALHTAEDAVELRRRLILFPAAPGNTADAFEPSCLLHAAHKDEPDGALATALLLLTDRRWRNATGRLIRRIEESELIPHDHLDLLAQTFLAADARVYWEAPGDWFDERGIAIDFDQHGVDDEPTSDELADDIGDGPVLVAREVRPPLRRWAAARAVRVEPTCWGALIKRARELDARSGAAIVRGILDGIDSLPPAARTLVVQLAAAWPQRDVREAASEIRDRRDRPTVSGPAPSTSSHEPEGAPAQPSLF